MSTQGRGADGAVARVDMGAGTKHLNRRLVPLTPGATPGRLEHPPMYMMFIDNRETCRPVWSGVSMCALMYYDFHVLVFCIETM